LENEESLLYCKRTNTFVQTAHRPWHLGTNDNSFGSNGWPGFSGLIKNLRRSMGGRICRRHWLIKLL